MVNVVLMSVCSEGKRNQFACLVAIPKAQYDRCKSFCCLLFKVLIGYRNVRDTFRIASYISFVYIFYQLKVYREPLNSAKLILLLCPMLPTSCM